MRGSARLCLRFPNEIRSCYIIPKLYNDCVMQQIDSVFSALADPTRRAILARLALGEATVNELAEPFAITKQAVSKHIQVLEQAGLVTRSRDAQRRPVHLNAAQLEALTAWIDRYRLIHEQRYRSLDSLLDQMTTNPTKEQ